MLACSWLALMLGCGDSVVETPATSNPTLRQVARDLPQPASEPPGAVRNRAPVIRSLRFEPAHPRPGQSMRAVAEATDPDGDVLQFAYEWYLNGIDVRAKSEIVSFPRGQKGDVVEVVALVSDSRGGRSEKRAQTRVSNSPPVLSAVHLEPVGPVERGEDLVARPEVLDSDQDSVRVHLEWQVNGRTRPDHGERFPTQPLRRGDQVQVFAIASDGEDESERVASPLVEIGNTPPQITSEPEAAREDGSFFYQVQARDPDNDRGLIFGLTEAPEGMTISRTDGELAWLPREDQLGDHRVVIVVDDRHGGKTSQIFEISIGEESPPPGPAASQ